MLPELYKFMEVYTRCIGPIFAKSDEAALFVTSDGIAFKEGTIGWRLAPFVEKCGVRLGSRMAFVDMRKVITTEMLQRASKEEQEICAVYLLTARTPLKSGTRAQTSQTWASRPPKLTITAQGLGRRRHYFRLSSVLLTNMGWVSFQKFKLKQWLRTIWRPMGDHLFLFLQDFVMMISLWWRLWEGYFDKSAHCSPYGLLAQGVFLWIPTPTHKFCCCMWEFERYFK